MLSFSSIINRFGGEISEAKYEFSEVEGRKNGIFLDEASSKSNSIYSKRPSESTNFIEVQQKKMPSIEIVHTYNNNHYVCKLKIKDLLIMSPRNWEMNRPADLDRCRSIVNHISRHNGAIDTIIYMIYENGTYKIIDGIHRYTAFYMLCETEEYKNDFDVVDMCLIKEKYVFISIMISPSIGETIEKFQALNKSVPISELYISPTENTEKRKIIEDTSRIWMTLYKSHFTHCPNPQIPNTNRDRFIDLLCLLYDKYNITTLNKHVLENKLNELNKFMMDNIPSKVSAKALQKCRDSGCYLFLVKKDVLETFI